MHACVKTRDKILHLAPFYRSPLWSGTLSIHNNRKHVLRLAVKSEMCFDLRFNRNFVTSAARFGELLPFGRNLPALGDCFSALAIFHFGDLLT